MNEHQKIAPWSRFNVAAGTLGHLLEHNLDMIVKPAEFSPTRTELDADAAFAIWWLTGRSSKEWVSERGRYEWTIRDLVRELRDDIRGRFMRLFINPSQELFNRVVPDLEQCYCLYVDKFLDQGRDESDFADRLRRMAIQAERGEVCFMLEGSAQNIGKLWAAILDSFCTLLLEELIHSPKQVSNLMLILFSDDPAEQVLSQCIGECLAIGVRPHIGTLRFITARLWGVVF